ncbi:MAG: phospholipase [Bacteroidales bacterium]|nr:phospholipase [Bacteroidales bacterium]
MSFSRKKNANEAEDEPIKLAETECCGAHEVCETDSLMAALSEEIEYFEDEELDSLKHTAPENYTVDQVDSFRDVFETLPEKEVAAWCRSLQLRGIELPYDLKDEVLLVVGERRFKTATK